MLRSNGQGTSVTVEGVISLQNSKLNAEGYFVVGGMVLVT